MLAFWRGAFGAGGHFMRLIFAIALSLSAATPAAIAMPLAKAPMPALSSANEAIIAVAKKRAPAKARPKARARKARRGKPDLGGIHPLVGSGDY